MSRMVTIARNGRGFLLGAVLAMVASCTPASPSTSSPTHPSPGATASTEPPASTASFAPAIIPEPPPDPPEDPRPPPLHNPDPFVFLRVPGHGDAVVSLPLGTREPRSIVLATHGNYDTPEWQCQVWRDIVQDDAFVLCPRGAARGDSPSASDTRYHYVSNQHLEKEIDAGVAALKELYPDYVDDGPMIFTGFSQGAIMGAMIMLRRPDRYPRAVLIEGGNRAWSFASAKKFAQQGGKRVLFACGQWDCNQRATDAQRALSNAGVEAEIVFSKGEGHSYGGGVAERILETFDWVVQGDDRWEHRRARRQP